MILRRKPATRPLPERLAAFRRAAELADHRLPDIEVVGAYDLAERAAGRLRHGTEFTLVALLGATGSGKSSVANAVAGSDVATTGVRRPTTSSSLALCWGSEDPTPLLDWLDVPNRHLVGNDQPELSGLVLLDVPDHDSVEVSNRLEMERIAEHADLLLWVTDHEKYADLAMHTYLRKLAGYGAVTAMVLNKIDTLSSDEVNACRNDLGRLLTDDGLGQATVVATSATTGQGIRSLTEVLATSVASQRAVVERLSADIDGAAEELSRHVADHDVDAEVSARTRAELCDNLVAASGLDAVTDAVQSGHKRDAATMMGWPFTTWARGLRPHPLRRLHLGQGSVGRTSLPEASGVAQTRARAAIRDAAESASAGMPEPWPALIRRAGQTDPVQLTDQLDRAVADATRGQTERQPTWWSLIRGVQWLVAIGVIVGAVWLGLLAFGAYLRLPDVPTPEVEGVPVPTALVIGGIAGGWLLSFLCTRLAAIGARRRAASVRREASAQVGRVVDELVLNPVEYELNAHNELRHALETAHR